MQTNEFNQPVDHLVENWQAAKMPPRVALHGKYCILEPLDLDKHGKNLFELLKLNSSEWTYLPYGPFNTYAEFFANFKTVAEEADTLLYAILEPTTQMPTGIAAYLRINPTHGVIEVGHLHYAKSLQRTPAATEAMYLLMRRAFEELGYRRYEWKCNTLNQPSRNAAERLGFKFEGVFRQHAVFKQRNRDTAWYSIIDAEWPQIKLRLEQWLHPDNFDSLGQQKQKLNTI